MSRDNNALENGSTIWEKIGYMKQLYDEFKGFFWSFAVWKVMWLLNLFNHRFSEKIGLQ